MATKTDISFHRGEDVTLRVTVSDQNITGWNLAFAVVRSYEENAVIEKTTTAGIAITNGPNGIFEVTIEDTDTDDLAIGGYVWGAKRTDAGQEALLAYGNLSLKPNVVE